MDEQVERAVCSRRRSEAAGGIYEMVSDKVVGILGQLVLCEESHDGVDLIVRDQDQKHPADDFEESVESFEGEADAECAIKCAH
jgi:hypothetical protein